MMCSLSRGLPRRLLAAAPRGLGLPAAAPTAAAPVAHAFAAACGRRWFALKARHRGCVYVPRKVARQALYKARNQKNSDMRLLLPPYISAGELRIIFRMDYPGVFRLLGVRFESSKYFWKDYDGRQFETTSKRKVMVPFELASIPAQALGFNPEMVDVEPDWEADTVFPSPSGRANPIKRLPGAPTSGAPPVPIVAVLGHINHGKTTLLDALCGTSIAAAEPGGITQGVRAMTWQLAGSDEPGKLLFQDSLPYSPGCRAEGRVDDRRCTFIDTPGHEVFELQRGRTMSAADVAVVVVSVEHGADVQTEEVLMHAARWRVPVVFALNKIDLPDAHLELTRAELRRQCQRLHEQGLVDVDWTREAEQAVPVSALMHRNLDRLMARVCEVVEALPALPATPLEPPSSTPGLAKATYRAPRRTDQLVGVATPPAAVALVVEVERGADTGEKVLTLIVRAGRLARDQWFVAGTAFGRITHLRIATGSDRLDGRSWRDADSATPGVAVQVKGLRTRKLGGDCAPDDFLYVLPQERAWRLSEHRRRLEELTALQSAGPPIEVAFELDPFGMGSRTQADMERSRHDQPERHSGTAFDRRWQQQALEEVRPADAADAVQGPPAFVAATRREFSAPLRSRPFGAPGAPGGAVVEEEPLDDEAPEVQRGGRRSARARRSAAAEPEAPPEDPSKRFAVVQPAGDEEADAAPSGGGRRSARGAQRAATGAWSSNRAPERDFVYYTDRTSFDEEADMDSTRVMSRWRWRDRARWDEQRRQEDLRKKEKKLAETIRRRVHGEASESESEEEQEDSDVERERSDDEDDREPLPRKNMPVVPMILKTKTMSQFDMLMDEVERLQEVHRCRIVIVHGGLGPVMPKDIVHAEVEKQYGYCPVYAFQVGCLPEAAGQASAEKIDIRRFNVFTDLLADVEGRCVKIRETKRLSRYTASLMRGSAPTASGL